MLSTPLDPSAPDADTLLSVTTLPRRRGRVAVEVVGEVDASTAPVLDACLQSSVDRPDLRVLEVRLERVSFFGAAGVAVLARADRRCRSRGARLVLRTGGRRCVLRPLELTGLADDVAVDRSEPSSRRGVRTAPRRARARAGSARRQRVC